jgi:hypothetical protein
MVIPLLRAEHHNMPGIVSAATPIRLGIPRCHGQGGGGIRCATNHAPLVVVECSAPLGDPVPERLIWVRLAPENDMATARALRQHGP